MIKNKKGNSGQNHTLIDPCARVYLGTYHAVNLKSPEPNRRSIIFPGSARYGQSGDITESARPGDVKDDLYIHPMLDRFLID